MVARGVRLRRVRRRFLGCRPRLPVHPTYDDSCLGGNRALPRERIRRVLEGLRPPEYRKGVYVLTWSLSIALAVLLVLQLTGVTTDSSTAPVTRLDVYSTETGKLLGHCRAYRVEGDVVAVPRPGCNEVPRCTGLGAKLPQKDVMVEAARWYSPRPGAARHGET